MLMRNLINNRNYLTVSSAISQVSSRIFNMVSNFVVLSILARNLTSEEFGFWGLLLSGYQIVQGFDLGLGSALRNSVTRYLIAGENDRARDVIRSALFLTVSAAMIAVPIFVFAPGIPALFGVSGVSQFSSTIRMVLSLSGFMISAGLIFQLYYCWSEIRLLSALETMRPIAQIALIFFLSKAGAPFGWYAAAFYGAFIGVGGLEVILLFRRRAWNVLEIPAFRSDGRDSMWITILLSNIRPILKESGAFSLISAAAAIMGSIDSVIVSHVSGVVSVGYYSVVQKMYFAGIALHITFLMNYWKIYTEKFHDRDFVWIRRTLIRYGLITFGVAFFVAMACVAEGRAVVKVWTGLDVGNPYLFLTFGIWMLLAMLNNHVSIFLNAVGCLRTQAVVMWVSIAINIPLAIALGRQYGPIGVNFSSIISTVFVLSVNILVSGRVLQKQG